MYVSFSCAIRTFCVMCIDVDSYGEVEYVSTRNRKSGKNILHWLSETCGLRYDDMKGEPWDSIAPICCQLPANARRTAPQQTVLECTITRRIHKLQPSTDPLRLER